MSDFEAQRLNQARQSDDEDGVITEIRFDKTDTCCCCTVYGGFYAYSSYYLLISILLLWILVAEIDNGADDQVFFLVATGVYAACRLTIAIMGFVLTNQLSNGPPIPSQFMINLWAGMVLWVPIIGNVIVMAFTVGLFVLLYAIGLNASDDENVDAILHVVGIVFFFYIALMLIPIIIDTSVAIAFYVQINKFIEKATRHKVYACALCKCC
eukprot:85569_1